MSTVLKPLPIKQAGLALAFILSGPSVRAELTPQEWLQRGLSDAPSYEADVVFVRTSGSQRTAERMRVLNDAGGRSRRDYYDSAGRVARTLLEVYGNQWLYLPRQRKLLTGTAPSSSPAERQRGDMELLLANYRLFDEGEKPWKDRPCRVLSLVPQMKGKPRQTLWIDRGSGVILRSLRGVDDHPEARFDVVRFLTEPTFSPSAFEVPSASDLVVAPHELDPDFYSLSQMGGAQGLQIRLPATLPGGYVFDSGDRFELNGSPVYALRLTDGLSMLTLFETVRPVQKLARLNGLPHDMQESGLNALRGTVAHVAQWKARARYYTLIGDCSPGLLQQIRRAIEPPRS